MNQQVPMLELQHSLADSQWLDEGELFRRQAVDLNALLEHAWRTVPAQKLRLDAAGYRLGWPITEEQFHQIVPVTREELQLNGSAWQSSNVPPDHGEIISVTSSGSTGRPITVNGTIRDAAIAKAFQLRQGLWHDVDFSEPLIAIWQLKSGEADYPDGARQDRWSDTATYPFPTGPLFELNIHETVARQAEWLARHQPGYLVTYPSNLRFLADHCHEIGLKLPKLKKVFTMAESISDEDRNACTKAWGVPVVDTYSAKEIGAAAIQCPENNHYHVQSERIILEVLRPDGSQAAPGEIGRVIVTSLHNYAQPLIRYEIGDLAVVGDACPCGRGLPVIKRFLGRVRNMMIRADGNAYWPNLAALSLRQLAPVKQFQMVQTAIERLEVRLVTERPLTSQEENSLLEVVGSRMPTPFEICITYHDQIPRSASGKWEDFYSLVSKR